MIIRGSKLKYSIIALGMCLLVLIISGCRLGNSNYHKVTAVGRVSSQTSTSISSKHELLDGREQYTIRVPEGEALAVLISISNQGGSLSLTVGKSDYAPVYTGHDIESSTFTVYLRESGDYRVIIEANHHKGSYSLNWSTISSGFFREVSDLHALRLGEPCRTPQCKCEFFGYSIIPIAFRE